jgi:hypothetical protein
MDAAELERPVDGQGESAGRDAHTPLAEAPAMSDREQPLDALNAVQAGHARLFEPPAHRDPDDKREFHAANLHRVRGGNRPTGMKGYTRASRCASKNVRAARNRHQGRKRSRTMTRHDWFECADTAREIANLQRRHGRLSVNGIVEDGVWQLFAANELPESSDPTRRTTLAAAELMAYASGPRSRWWFR